MDRERERERGFVDCKRERKKNEKRIVRVCV